MLFRAVVDLLPARVRRSTPIALALHVAEFRHSERDGLTTKEYEWLISDDTGVSSLTIFTVLSGRNVLGGWSPSAPRDAWDFGRCHRLLQRFPKWRARLDEVGVLHPEWAPLVGDWTRLTALFEEGDHATLNIELRRHLDSPAARVR